MTLWEFILVMGVMFVPPFILSGGLLVWFMRRNGRSRRRCSAAVVVMVPAAILLTILLYEHLPEDIRLMLDTKDIRLFGGWFPVMPLVWVAAALAATGAGWILGRAKPDTTQ